MQTEANRNTYPYFGQGAEIHPTAKIVCAARVVVDDRAAMGDFSFVNACGFARTGKCAHLADCRRTGIRQHREALIARAERPLLGQGLTKPRGTTPFR